MAKIGIFVRMQRPKVVGIMEIAELLFVVSLIPIEADGNYGNSMEQAAWLFP